MACDREPEVNSTFTTQSLIDQGCADVPVDRATARLILDPASVDLLTLVQCAGSIREHFYGRHVRVHQLHNVQSGACPEDCGYCGQSRDSKAPIQPYILKSRESIIAQAEKARAAGAYRYCMVLSGRGPSDEDIDHMAQCISEIKSRFGLRTCLSAGLMDEEKALRLKSAGLDRLNHNLNTSAAHYPEICSTHTYEDRVNTLKAASSAGLETCSGLIVGMDERLDDLVDTAFALRDLRVPSIPVNFLVPIPGNPLQQAVVEGRGLTPEFVVRVLCMMRLVNPSAEVRIGAGREGHLRSLQALALYPANSLFVDGYLLTRGSAAHETIAMIVDAGFEIEIEGNGEWARDVQALVDAQRRGGTDAFAVGGGDDVILPEQRKTPRDRSSKVTPVTLGASS